MAQLRIRVIRGYVLRGVNSSVNLGFVAAKKYGFWEVWSSTFVTRAGLTWLDSGWLPGTFLSARRVRVKGLLKLIRTMVNHCVRIPYLTRTYVCRGADVDQGKHLSCLKARRWNPWRHVFPSINGDLCQLRNNKLSEWCHHYIFWPGVHDFRRRKTFRKKKTQLELESFANVIQITTPWRTCTIGRNTTVY